MTPENKVALFSEAVLLVQGENTYRINYVEFDDKNDFNTAYVIMTDDTTDEEYKVYLNEIDLGNPKTLLYGLRLLA
jgi:hypothetical protein